MNLARKIIAPFHKEKIDAEMSEEMRLHLERRTGENIASGMAPAEARYAALRRFGGVEQAKEIARDQRGFGSWNLFVRNIRFSARSLRKSPAFTVTALATLALCIGANLAIFATVDAILLRPLPFPGPDRLVAIFNTYPKAGVINDGNSVANYYERRGRIDAFSSLSIYREETAVVGESGATQRQAVMRVSPEFFATLGVPLALGRAFGDEETMYQTESVAILTDAYWRDYFQSDPRVLERELRVDGVSRRIVGVLPRGFRFLSSEARLYFPFASDAKNRLPSERHAGGGAIKMIARLKPGASLSGAQAQIDTLNAALSSDDPEAKQMAEAGFRSPVVSLHGDHVAAIRPVLLLVQGGALCLLLIGAVNIVNLLLIRAGARTKELAVRQALGASRAHVVGEVLAETTLLATVGGLMGLVLGGGGIRALAWFGADRLPLGAHISFDARLALVAWLGTIGMGGLLAVPIAWFNLRAPRAGPLPSSSRGATSGRAAQRLRHTFIVAQIALAFVLLAGAGLLGTNLRHVMAISPGFRPGGVLSGQISLPYNNYRDNQARLAFTEKLDREIARLPGVLAVGVATNVPFSGNSGKSSVTVVGHTPRAGETPRACYSFAVDGDYFTALGFALRQGRFLTAEDSRQAVRSCVVDEDFARLHWPAGNAIGQRLHPGSSRSGESRD
ncbi:MAG: ABC transporter permease, partial [Opitutaceae bacterium]